MVIEHWVEYFIPGSLFSESDYVKLQTRNVAAAVAKMPKNAFAFQLYDVCVREGVLEDGKKITDRKEENRSGRYYPDGKLYSLQEAIADHGEKSILVSNMRCNKWDPLVKTRLGNHQPFEKDDMIISTHRAEAFLNS